MERGGSNLQRQRWVFADQMLWKIDAALPRKSGLRADIALFVPRTDFLTRQVYRSDFLGRAVASTFSLLKTDLQPLLSDAHCLCMQAVIRSTSGTSALHNRMASSEQSRCCCSV